MRQMRRINRQITDREKLRQIIEDCKVVRIGAMDAEGLFVLPVNYGYDLEGDRLTLYIHSAKEGRKAELFLEGAEVAFEMDRGHRLITGGYTCAYSYAYQSIMGNGRIELVKTDEEKRYGLKRLMEHLAPEHAAVFSDEMVDAVNVYCLKADHFTGKERA